MMLREIIQNGIARHFIQYTLIMTNTRLGHSVVYTVPPDLQRICLSANDCSTATWKLVWTGWRALLLCNGMLTRRDSRHCDCSRLYRIVNAFKSDYVAAATAAEARISFELRPTIRWLRSSLFTAENYCVFGRKRKKTKMTNTFSTENENENEFRSVSIMCYLLRQLWKWLNIDDIWPWPLTSGAILYFWITWKLLVKFWCISTRQCILDGPMIFIYLFIYLKSTTEWPEGHLYCLKFRRTQKNTQIHTVRNSIKTERK